ncbi:MAG: flippase-like domain-containing protein [Eubacterium sp.]|nr:flippase-like domain-containing protein [Eubacterium sp.]
MKKSRKSNLISNLIKWIIIIIILVIVYFWKNEEITDAFREIKQFPFWVTILCLLATILHFVTEGRIIHDMTMYEDRQMTWWEAFKCGLYCAFYKLASLGSLSGIAEVYYIAKHDIDPGRSTGITLIQYAYQKLGITILGATGFVILYVSGVSTVNEYAKWGVLGTLVALGIVLILILAATVRKAADFFAFIIKKILGEGGLVPKLFGRSKKGKDASKIINLSKEIIDKIYSFNEAGLSFWAHKSLCVRVTFLKMVKMLLWYSVAGITVYAAQLAKISGTDPHIDVVKYMIIPIILMAVSNMIGTVMVAPAGAGTLEFVVSLLFAPLYGNTAATVVILYRFYSMVVPFVLGAIVFASDKPGNIKES